MNTVNISTCFLVVFAVLPLIMGCQPASASDLVMSEKPRNVNPDITDDNFKAQMDGNTEFALNLYAILKNEPGNLFFSPFSISTALAMTYEGARGVTEKQMMETLKFIEPKQSAHDAFNKLDLSLKKQMENSKRDKESGFKLDIANSIWAQKGYPWKTEFLDALGVNYGAGIFSVDYMKEAENIRLKINSWVEEKTYDKIRELIPKDILDESTRMVLVNAIYFYGKWMREFEKEGTYNGAFKLLDGSSVQVPMMHQTESFRYMSAETFQALEMNYRDCDISMLIILPAIEKYDEVESSLSLGMLSEIISNLEYREVILTLPKFKLEARFELSDTLKGMGMPSAFGFGDADFSGMDGTKNLFISNVIHKAFVAVDEKGTEAAAATAVVMKEGAMMDEEDTVEFKADHPFIFAIRDNQTNSILFLGRLHNPK